MKQVFKPTTVSHLEQPMFFGEPVDIARFDEVKLSWLDKLTEKQLSFFWRPEEVDVTKDRIDFAKLSEAEKFMFTSNLKYQILLDSVQGRSPNLAFLPIASLPELESWIETWAFSESVHSRSYTHIIRNVYANPTEVFDTITDIPEIISRAKSVTEEYDKLIEFNNRLALSGSNTFSFEHACSLFKTLAAVNILEGVRFYVSFACAWSFNERALMEGNAKIISLISRDEALHLSGTQLMLQHLMVEWKGVAEACKQDVYELFNEAVAQEKEWASYLFSKGSVIGLNDTILSQYVEYIANVRLRAIGYDRIYPTVKNPLPWTLKYISSDAVQVAPQESEISSYLTGALDTRVEKDTFSDFSL